MAATSAMLRVAMVDRVNGTPAAAAARAVASSPSGWAMPCIAMGATMTGKDSGMPARPRIDGRKGAERRSWGVEKGAQHGVGACNAWSGRSSRDKQHTVLRVVEQDGSGAVSL